MFKDRAMNIYKTIDVNYEENGGCFYPGMAKEVVLLLGINHYDELKAAYVKGNESLFINDIRFVPSMTCWYFEENDTIEVTPIPNNSGVVRLPKEVFYKYFVTPTRKES